MSDDSGGLAKEQKQKASTRHYSIGSMSSQEINKIIGIDVVKKSKQIKTYIDKNRSQIKHKMEKLPGSIKNLSSPSDTNNIDKIDDANLDDVFKPRSSVLRTPTEELPEHISGASDPNPHKRPRSDETSPDPLQRKKTTRGLGKTQQGEDEKISENNTEQILKIIYDSLNAIQIITSQDTDNAMITRGNQNHINLQLSNV